MKYLLFVSLIFGFGTASHVDTDRGGFSNECFKSSVPKFSSALYSASIDVTGHHISGLLFLKTMPDSSQRVVFSNEAGITFFDFEWRKSGEFKTHHVIKKLRRRVVINTLKKDFELVVMPTQIAKTLERNEGDKEYEAIRRKEKVIFKTDQGCQSIISVDVMRKKKKVVEVRFFPVGKNIPDSVSIAHLNFNMKIGLKKLDR